MKKTYSFIGLIVLTIALFSCSNSEKYKAEIKQLDSMMVLLDSATLKINSIDTAKMAEQLIVIKQDLKTCNEYIKDTLSVDAAMMLSEYRSSAKPFDMILEKYTPHIEDLNKSKSQIKSLIHDLKIDKVDSEKIKQYIQDEIIAADKSIKDIDILENLAKIYSEKFETYKPQASEFISTLEK